MRKFVLLIALIVVFLWPLAAAPLAAGSGPYPAFDSCWHGDNTFELFVTNVGGARGHFGYSPQYGGEPDFSIIVDLGFFEPGETRQFHTVIPGQGGAIFYPAVKMQEEFGIWSIGVQWGAHLLGGFTPLCPGDPPPPPPPGSTPTPPPIVVTNQRPIPNYGLAYFDQDTGLFWCADVLCLTDYTVPAGQTARLAARDPENGFWLIQWANLRLYVPVDHVTVRR